MADQHPDEAPSLARPETVSQAQHVQTSLPQRLEIIPDSLLALAKDARYVKECQALFLQVLSSIFPRRRHPLLEQESWILASLLCLALGLRQTGKGTTLGMETVGLQFPMDVSRWKLVASTLVALSWAYAFSPHRTTTTTTITDPISPETVNGNTPRLLSEDTQQNDEMLRGVSRREFHERQRRAMLQRANQAAASATSTRTEPTPINGIENLVTEDNARHQHPQCQSSSNHSQQRRSNHKEWAAAVQKRLKSVLLLLARILASATFSPFEGPHTLPAETNEQQHQQHNQPNNATIQQTGRWLAKLHLAHFCWTGIYPTWVHRFCGHSLQPAGKSSSGSSSPASRLYHQPTTARLVGLILGAQLVVTVVQASSSALSRWLVHREQTVGRSLTSSSSSQGQHTPAVVFQSAATASDMDNAVGNTTGSNPGSKSICSICKMERTHPAAPSSCGHVFCWKCLIQWVSSIRPECPLCRASCRPQDIVALYNYSPNR